MGDGGLVHGLEVGAGFLPLEEALALTMLW